MEDTYELDARVEKSSLGNRKWFYKYRDYKREGSFDSAKQYISTIRNLYESYNHQDIETIGPSDLKLFLNGDKYRKLSYKNTAIAHLNSFFTFLIDNGVHIEYPIIDELNGNRAQKEELSLEETRKPIPLSIREVVALRELLRESQNYSMLFVFEVIYRYGLQMKDMVQLYKKNYDDVTHTFTINRNLSIQVDEDIHQLILNNSVLSDRKFNITTFDYRINEIRKLFRKDFLYKDIYQTHKMHFIPCPICETPTKNTPSLWAILEFEEDKSQWMVCKSCAMSKKI